MQPAPTKEPSNLKLWACGLFVAAGITWAGVLAVTIADISLDDRIPNSYGVVGMGIGVTLILTGVTFYLVDQQRRYLLDAWAALRDELLGAIRAARREASADIDAARRDLKTDTGSIPRITDKMLEFPTIGDAFGAVAMLSAEVQKVTSNVDQLMARHEWLMADRKRLQVALAEAAKGGSLSHSEYWQVYQDVMSDLGDMPADPAEG